MNYGGEEERTEDEKEVSLKCLSRLAIHRSKPQPTVRSPRPSSRMFVALESEQITCQTHEHWRWKQRGALFRKGQYSESHTPARHLFCAPSVYVYAYMRTLPSEWSCAISTLKFVYPFYCSRRQFRKRFETQNTVERKKKEQAHDWWFLSTKKWQRLSAAWWTEQYKLLSQLASRGHATNISYKRKSADSEGGVLLLP